MTGRRSPAHIRGSWKCQPQLDSAMDSPLHFLQPFPCWPLGKRRRPSAITGITVATPRPTVAWHGASEIVPAMNWASASPIATHTKTNVTLNARKLRAQAISHLQRRPILPRLPIATMGRPQTAWRRRKNGLQRTARRADPTDADLDSRSNNPSGARELQKFRAPAAELANRRDRRRLRRRRKLSAFSHCLCIVRDRAHHLRAARFYCSEHAGLPPNDDISGCLSASTRR